MASPVVSAVKVFVAAFMFGPLDGFKKAVDAAAEFVGGKLTKEQNREMERISQECLAAVQEVVALDGLSAESRTVALVTFQELALHHPVRPEEILLKNYDARSVARLWLERGQSLLVGLDLGTCELLRRMVEVICERLMPHLASTREMELAFRRWVLSELGGKTPPSLDDVFQQYLGREGLLYVPSREWNASIHSPVAMLTAQMRVVPLEDRGAHLQQIFDWCQKPTPRISTRVVTGIGGRGKTRLLIEACRRLRTEGWNCGFLRAEAAVAPPGAIVALWSDPRALLVVIDYAETRVEEVKCHYRVLEEVTRERPVRIVLIARSAGEWWRQLCRSSALLQGPAAADTGQSWLPSLEIPPSRRHAIFSASLKAFAARLGAAVPSATIAKEKLDRPEFSSVLGLHAAALSLLLDTSGKLRSGPFMLADILRFILDREREVWTQRIDTSTVLRGKIDEAEIELAAALLVLRGGASGAVQAASLLKEVPSLADQPRAVLERVGLLLHELYGGERWIEPLQPDTVGEHLVYEVMSERDALWLLDARSMSDDEAKCALTVMCRVGRCHDDADDWLMRLLEGDTQRMAPLAVQVAVETGDPIGRLLARVARQVGDEALARLLDAMDLRAVTLLDVRLWLDERKYLESHAARSTIEERLMHLENCVNLANSQLASGEHEEAFKKADEAFVAARALRSSASHVRVEQALFEACYVTARAALMTDRKELAFLANDEALNLLLELGERPVAALQTCGLRGQLFQAVGRHVHALEAFDLALSQPWNPESEYEASLRLPTLFNMATSLVYVDRIPASLQIALEGVELARRMAARKPEKYEFALAHGLCNCAEYYLLLGEVEKAVECSREAVAALRALPAHIFGANQAYGLLTLAMALKAADVRTEAESRLNEAMGLLRASSPIYAHSRSQIYETYAGVLHMKGEERISGIFADCAKECASVSDDCDVRKRGK